jgi:hypothetical protein
MWKQDKRAYIGLYGSIASMILLVIKGIIFENKFSLFLNFLCFFFLLAALFLMGLYLKGIKLGIILTVGFMSFLLVGSLYADFSRYLVNNDYLSKSSSRILDHCAFIGLILFICFLPKLLAKRSNRTDGFPQQIDDGIRREESLDGTYIILIKPSEIKVDMVYKVFKKDYSLFFCRVGGQSFEINQQFLCDATPDTDGEQLLSGKNNFAIRCEDIVNIMVCNKLSYGRPNNGTVQFSSGSNKIKFLIHPVTEYDYLIKFFKDNDIEYTERKWKYLFEKKAN